jgi:hypothetical protein
MQIDGYWDDEGKILLTGDVMPFDNRPMPLEPSTKGAEDLSLMILKGFNLINAAALTARVSAKPSPFPFVSKCTLELRIASGHFTPGQ